MDLGLEGKVALVTASSKGLGRAAARSLAAEGAKVVICARGADALAATATELRTAGADVHAVARDVGAPDAPAELVGETVGRFGSLDILVANNGGPPPGRALEVDDEQVRDAIEANLLTSVRLVREALPHMQAAGGGRICLITSRSVKEPLPGLALSNIARTGLWAWAKTAAADLFPAGITLNLACPGFHATERMREVGLPQDVPVGDPADFGDVVAFLCSQQARFISGTAVLVDGASTAGLL